MKTLGVVLSMLLGAELFAGDSLKLRHNFAEMYVSSSMRLFNARDFETRIHIGAFHFWDWADLYVSFPVASSGAGNYGVETGAKFFPLQAVSSKFRPFIGSSLNIFNFQEDKASVFQQSIFPIHLGFVYSFNKLHLNLGGTYLKSRDFAYPLANSTVKRTINPLSFEFGLRYSFDVTASASPSWESGVAQQRTRELAAEGKLDGLSIGLGASSNWLLTGRRQLALNTLLLPKASASAVDIGIGYYWYKADFQVNLSIRPSTIKSMAFEDVFSLKRLSSAVEAFKFFGDYHGFVPFAGLFVSAEHMRARLNAEKSSDTKAGSGIVFGWDIRPNSLQAFVLRTNLRYYPKLKFDGASGVINLSQIEFNFIQLVIYPNRF